MISKIKQKPHIFGPSFAISDLIDVINFSKLMISIKVLRMYHSFIYLLPLQHKSISCTTELQPASVMADNTNTTVSFVVKKLGKQQSFDADVNLSMDVEEIASEIKSAMKSIETRDAARIKRQKLAIEQIIETAEKKTTTTKEIRDGTGVSHRDSSNSNGIASVHQDWRRWRKVHPLAVQIHGPWPHFFACM